MASPKRDNELAAQALADAVMTSDAQACSRHGIALRTLQNYRASLKSDIELARVFAQKLQVVREKTWSEELDSTLTSSVRHLGDMIASAAMSGQHDAETLSAITTAVLGLAELAMTRDMITQQIEASRPRVVQEAKALPATN